MSDKVCQEFYCNDCDGFIRVKLNTELNYSVVVVCPSCGRKHPRTIENGYIYDRGSRNGTAEEICPPKSAYSKTSISANMRKHERHGIELTSEERQPMYERWMELYGDKV